MKIAVLDTGVDATHPALAGHLLPGHDFVDNDDDPSEVGDQQTGPYGHGTHVAGLLALFAPEAKIIPLRVLNPRGEGNIWVLAEALSYAVNHGADVISMSLATPRQTHLLGDMLKRVSDDATQVGDDFPDTTANPGLVVVAGAGNTGDTTSMYPAAENIGGLIGVAASTQEDTLASFSTRGSWIKVMAPGDKILSSVPSTVPGVSCGPGGCYGTWSGTSMATPIVAAEVALVRAMYPGLRNDKIARHIAKNSVNIPGSPIQKRIDVGLAVSTAPQSDVTPTPTPTPPTTPIDAAPFFVQQQYFDFLNRQPDSFGLGYWTDQIAGNLSNTPAPCPAGDANCVLQRRITVSAAFFIESEFQDTGGFVYRLYKSSLGRRPAYTEFMVDRLRVVGGPTLDASKQIFADAWVQRPSFWQSTRRPLMGQMGQASSMHCWQPCCRIPVWTFLHRDSHSSTITTPTTVAGASCAWLPTTRPSPSLSTTLRLC